MFPLPITTWIMIGLSVFAMAGFGYGRYEHNAYIEYKAEVLAVAKVQETKNESIQKQSDLVNKGIQNAYEAKLAALRNYYGGLHNTGSSSMSGISPAPKGADAETAYPILAGQCAATTAQLTSLQDWINEQMGIK